MKQLCPGEVCIKLKPRRFEVNQWVSESVDLFLCSLLLLRRDRRKCDEQIDQQAAGVVWIAIPFVCLQLKTKRPLGHKKKRFPSFVPAGVCTVWVPITVMGWDIFFFSPKTESNQVKGSFPPFSKTSERTKVTIQSGGQPVLFAKFGCQTVL